MTLPSLTIATLKAGYESGALGPAAVLDRIYDRIEAEGERPIWITLVPRATAQSQLEALQTRKEAGESLPLFGVPFAVKDNIDVAGLPTTAACPAFAYKAEASAPAVERLIAAGAILIGKTNLDQFATGLVGARSPYGACSSVFDKRFISGGSSAGSAVAVAAGLVSFALGTDTAGSGRVPAAFNNIVGLKPTKGSISLRGVVPACRSLDCVSILAGTVDDARTVFDVAAGFDDADPYSRQWPGSTALTVAPAAGFCFGIPTDPLDFFGDAEAEALYAAAVARLEALGGVRVDIDFNPFAEAARLLYGGPWVAERLTALRRYNFDVAKVSDPIVREIIASAEPLSAADTFEGMHTLASLCRTAEHVWEKVDALLLPTAGTIYRLDQIAADPIVLNANLGRYTNFVNLMDLCAVAVPAGFRSDGLPFGVTVIGRAFDDGRVAAIADRLHRALPQATIGATGEALPAVKEVQPMVQSDEIALAVVGAHLSGEPLNWQITSRGGTFVKRARTAPGYRLYALSGGDIEKPGLVYDNAGAGLIDVEIWTLGSASFGAFVAEIPPPLCIGTLTLEDGGRVKGFLCEAYAARDAQEITSFGGWRRWRARNST